MFSIEELILKFNSSCKENNLFFQPDSLYAPASYILNIGGKRIRPALLLAAYNLYSEDIAYGFQAAFAIEIFHNFTLVHDDIIDVAKLRRGKQTVHLKYGIEQAILTGDVMLIYAYKYFSQYPPGVMNQIIPHFTQTAIKICEGQQFDKDFENQSEVPISAYIRMIEYKTAVLVGEALRIGGVLGNAHIEDLNHLYQFGKYIGIAFQLQDDVLDSFGDQQKFGKKIGGDILQKKKTYLYLKTRELLPEKEIGEFDRVFFSNESDQQSKIDHIISYYSSVFVQEYAKQVIEAYTQLALSHLNSLSVHEDKKKIINEYSNQLMSRAF